VIEALIGLVVALAPAPAIRQDPIPFGADRQADMRRYSRRHYGRASAALSDPEVIVIHFTANDSFQATWNTFAPNRPDPSFGELPNTCAHFVVDEAGTIHQLVPLGLRCRHTVGLNWTAIGIEHVGRSDAQVMGNRRQLAASLRLVRWLRDRHGIAAGNVIGHNESLSSPYHHERVRSMRTQTHGDFVKATMDRYRAML